MIQFRNAPNTLIWANVKNQIVELVVKKTKLTCFISSAVAVCFYETIHRVTTISLCVFLDDEEALNSIMKDLAALRFCYQLKPNNSNKPKNRTQAYRQVTTLIQLLFYPQCTTLLQEQFNTLHFYFISFIIIFAKQLKKSTKNNLFNLI